MKIARSKLSNYLTKYTKKQDKGSQMKITKTRLKQIIKEELAGINRELPTPAATHASASRKEEVEAESVHEQVTPDNLQVFAEAMIKMATDPAFLPLIAAVLAKLGWSLIKKDSDQPK